MSYNNYDMLKTYEDLRSVLSNLGNDIYKVDKKNIQNSKNKLELILNNLAFYLSEINGIPLHQENVKFISSDDMKKKCNNGFACADPVDKSIYFSIDNIFNAINQIKESKKYTYSSTGMAIFMIDCITHELKHRDQFLYTDETKKISKEKSSFNLKSSQWLNSMYFVHRSIVDAKISPNLNRIDYIASHAEAEAYQKGVEGTFVFLKLIGRTQDFNKNDTFWKKQLNFHKFAATYGRISFHPTENGSWINIAEKFDTAFSLLPKATKQQCLKDYPILSIQYNEDGQLKSIPDLVEQYFSIYNQKPKLDKENLQALNQIYCFIFANRITKQDLPFLYKKYGKLNINGILFKNIKEQSEIYTNYYTECYNNCKSISQNPDFDPGPFSIQNNINSLDNKYSASIKYLTSIKEKLNNLEKTEQILFVPNEIDNATCNVPYQIKSRVNFENQKRIVQNRNSNIPR